jgi:hypothetical protein
MEKQSPNPYFNLAMIRNVDMFFGRTKLLRRFYTALANRQSVSILGRRRVGKSSFLWCASLPQMQAHFSFDLSRHIFTFLDLHDYLHKTSEDFFQLVSREIIEQSEQVPGLALTLPAEANGADAFSRVLDQIVRCGFFTVLLLDSFDKVTLNKNFSPEFFGFLRAQASRGRVSYVTASMSPLYEVCHQSIEGSPFFNIFYAYTLGALEPEEARDLITIPASQAGVTWTEKEIALVSELAGRHPFFIQRTCHFLFEEKTQSGNEEIDELRLRDDVYNDLLPHFKDSWDQPTGEEQQLLLHEVMTEESQQRKFPELSESALFRKFIFASNPVGQFSISVEELERALNKINDLEALGNESLALMQIVLRRLRKNTTLTTLEIGTVVREVLTLAFERLKPAGIRSDAAAEWRNYNILYYRYFKYHLKNEQIAARLGSGSVRQFYRERSKAIEALRTVLLELERGAMY